MTDNTQPEALRLAEQYDYGDPVTHSNMWKVAVCNELRRQHARIAELEAVGAGGVQALSAAPTTSFEKVLSAYLTEDGFIAADDIPSICKDFARLLVVMKSAVRWAPSSAYWSEQLRSYFGEDARDGIEALEAQLRAALAASPTPPAEQKAGPGAVDRTGCTAGTDEECTRRGCATSCPAQQAAPNAAPGEPVASAAKDAIMGAAYDFRDAHISGSMNLKRSAHAILEAAVDNALAAQAAPQQQAPVQVSTQWLAEMIMSDCGCSTQNQRLLDRIIERITQYESANTTPPAEQQARYSRLHDADALHGQQLNVYGTATTTEAVTPEGGATTEAALGAEQAAPKAVPVTQQAGYAEVIECGNSYAKVKLKGEAFGSTRVGDIFYTAPQQEVQEPCQTCVALARTVMLDQVSFDRKPDCYGIRQITDDEGIEEWEDIRTSPDVAREEANDMMATGRGEIYEVVPLWTTPQHAPQPAQVVGNSGFDYKTAADFLNGKTISDEAVRKFVAASRWAHDERAALSATLLAMHGVLTSREAEIALLKKALLEADTAPQPAPAPLSECLRLLNSFEYEGDEDSQAKAFFKAHINEDWFFHVKNSLELALAAQGDTP